MADKKEKTSYTFLSAVRAAFCNAVSPKAFEVKGQPKGEPRYDATFMLEPDSPDLKALQTLVVAEARLLFPGKKLVTRRLTQEEYDDGGVVEIQVPWKSGDREADKAKQDGKDREFFRGKIALKVSSKYPPSLSAVDKGKIVSFNDVETRPTLDKMFYSGAWMVPLVSLHSYKARDDKPGGVGLWIDALCFIKHDQKIAGGGKVNAAEVFKGYAGAVSAENPGSNDALEDDFSA